MLSFSHYFFFLMSTPWLVGTVPTAYLFLKCEAHFSLALFDLYKSSDLELVKTGARIRSLETSI
jgi:hypothetical protein